MHSTQVRKYASTQVRKYASTLKTSAILVAGLVGLWLGIMGQVSASTESERWVAPRPSAEDCGFPDNPIVYRWADIMRYYEYEDKYTLDEFKAAMNDLLTSPELINCNNGLDTIAHLAAWGAYVETVKWAVSKGIDLTITQTSSTVTAYDIAIFCSRTTSRPFFCAPYNNLTDAERKARFLEVAQILKPPPAPATKSCAEVDGQIPLPSNEYCIVAENVQSSRRIEVWSDMEKRWIGDYRYEADKSLSGTGFYPGWKAEITFACSSAASSGCGYADYSLPSNLTPEYRDIWDKAFKERYGINVFCDGSIDVLGLDRDLEPGESMSITYSSDLERSAPRFVNCKAIALDPFTLTVKTTRLAQ